MPMISEIAREIKRQQSKSVGSALFNSGNVLGIITPTMKLKLDNFKHELEWMKLRSVGNLQVGDRVLVAIVNKGTDHVITGVID